MRYASAAALRAALDQRLLTQARETRIDIARLRRRVVFERLLVRFARSDAQWILKGAAALEVRLADRARMTRDLDVALIGVRADEPSVRETLVDALQADPDGDLFEFRVTGFRAMAIDGALDPVWRSSLDCRLDGRTFDLITVDIALGRPDRQHVEMIRLPGELAFAAIGAAEMPTIDRLQHFAEKLHALVRTYGERPSTRVKDLADLVLLIDSGLPASADLCDSVSEVFAARGAAGPPDVIPDPPADWTARYADLAEQLRLTAPTLGAAILLLRHFWSRCQSLARGA